MRLPQLWRQSSHLYVSYIPGAYPLSEQLLHTRSRLYDRWLYIICRSQNLALKIALQAEHPCSSGRILRVQLSSRSLHRLQNPSVAFSASPSSIPRTTSVKLMSFSEDKPASCMHLRHRVHCPCAMYLLWKSMESLMPKLLASNMNSLRPWK